MNALNLFAIIEALYSNSSWRIRYQLCILKLKFYVLAKKIQFYTARYLYIPKRVYNATTMFKPMLRWIFWIW